MSLFLNYEISLNASLSIKFTIIHWDIQKNNYIPKVRNQYHNCNTIGPFVTIVYKFRKLRKKSSGRIIENLHIVS